MSNTSAEFWIIAAVLFLVISAAFVVVLSQIAGDGVDGKG